MIGVCLIENALEYGGLVFGTLLALASFPCAAYLARFGVRHRICMLLICCGLVFVGFGVYLVMGENPLGAMCDSIHSFFPSRGDFRTFPIEEWVPCKSALYFLFHWLVLVYILSIVLAVFGIGLVNRVIVWWRVLRRSPINVFWDYSSEAWNLAKSIGGSGTKCADGADSVVFALREENKAWFMYQMSGTVQSIAKAGWKWVFGAPGRDSMLSHANRHFFLSPNGHENVAGAEALITMLDKLELKGAHTRVYVRVHSLATDDVVFRWADAWNEKKDNDIEIIILREESIVSRDFLLQNPMLDCPTIGIDTEHAVATGEFRILLLGFGSQGKTLLNDMICDAQYLSIDGEGLKISVDVVDKCISAYGEYLTNNDEAVRRYNMRFHHMNVRRGRFWEWVHEQLEHGGWNRIVVGMRNDRENISVATEIGRYCKWLGKESKGILFARVRDPHITAYTKKAMVATTNGGFSVFGSIADTYRYDAIVNDKWDDGAMMLNFCWNGSPPKATPKQMWKIASCFNRESSRASFFFQRNMLRLLGYRVDESTSDITGFNQADVAFHLDVLSRIEHLRWMAWHFVRGIKPFSDDMVGKYPKANQIETRNAHGDLVDFDKLHNHEKKKDINLVASDAWQRSGLGIRRA